MSSGITATSLASNNYSSYVFSNSATGQAYSSSTSLSAYTKEHYGVSNLTNALSSLGSPVNGDGITNVDAYAKNSYLSSQSSVYGRSSGSVNFSTLAGTASNYAQAAYEAQSNNLTSQAVNLYGISSASGYADNAYAASNLSPVSTAASTYQQYASSSTYIVGNLLDQIS